MGLVSSSLTDFKCNRIHVLLAPKTHGFSPNGIHVLVKEKTHGISFSAATRVLSRAEKKTCATF